MLGAVPELVVVDGPQPVSEHLSVNARVHRVSSDAEDGQAWEVSARVLLFGQVLVELSIGESLEAIVLLVLLGLLFELFVFLV